MLNVPFRFHWQVVHGMSGLGFPYKPLTYCSAIMAKGSLGPGRMRCFDLAILSARQTVVSDQIFDKRKQLSIKKVILEFRGSDPWNSHLYAQTHLEAQSYITSTHYYTRTPPLCTSAHTSTHTHTQHRHSHTHRRRQDTVNDRDRGIPRQRQR